MNVAVDLFQLITEESVCETGKVTSPVNPAGGR
jgi:hypothetical protein